MIPGNWIPQSNEEAAKQVSVKLVRRSGFSIRWPALTTDREIVMEERRFYEVAKREEWVPRNPREITFKRIGETNEFLEV